MALPQNMGFFEWLFQLGIGLEGDPGYYEGGEATEAEFRNLFTIATNEINNLNPDNPVREQYYQWLEQMGAIEGDPTFYTSEEAAPGDFTNLINVASGFFSETEGEIDTSPAEPIGVMPGGETIRVGDQWYQAYEFPAGSGEFMVFQYNNREQVVATFGDIPGFQDRSETWLNQNAIVQASAEEVIGETVSFQRFTTTLMEDAAAAAGVRDPSLIGRIASNPEMQQILAQAIAGDWTAQQVLAEQRQTNFWKNELYPGIETFYGRSIDPEREYQRYIQEVEPALEALGYERGPDGSYKNQVARMLDNNIDASLFVSQAPVFVRAVQNSEFASVLNQWAESELGREVGFNDWFDLMAGQAQPELEEVAERATLQYVAQQQGVSVTEGQIEDIARRSQLSEAEALQAFGGFQRAVLATSAFRRSRFSEDDVLRAFAGVDPSQGSIEEVKLEVAKIAREEGLLDDEKLNFYIGFTPQGTPMRPGLQALAAEGA